MSNLEQLKSIVLNTTTTTTTESSSSDIYHIEVWDNGGVRIIAPSQYITNNTITINSKYEVIK